LEENEPILEVRDFSVGFEIGKTLYRVLDSVSFKLREGEILALVGESGSGKTLTALSIIGLLPQNARILSGEIFFEGKNILEMSGEEKRRIRRSKIATIFQDPVNYLDPLMTIKDQLAEVASPDLVRDSSSSVSKSKKTSIKEMSLDALRKAGFKDPEQVLSKHPHELSGGMCQRAMLAMALVRSPKIILADEITTALDVTTQAGLLSHLKELKEEYDLSVLMITHDIGVVASTCDRMVVLYAGMVFEMGGVSEVIKNPIQPYTKALLSSIPKIGSTKLEPIPGVVPSIAAMPDGCRFHPRCMYAVEKCATTRPPIIETASGRTVVCHVFQGE
jgi:peptide/nickel transport system ATP-binding protein